MRNHDLKPDNIKHALNIHGIKVQYSATNTNNGLSVIGTDRGQFVMLHNRIFPVAPNYYIEPRGDSYMISDGYAYPGSYRKESRGC